MVVHLALSQRTPHRPGVCADCPYGAVQLVAEGELDAPGDLGLHVAADLLCPAGASVCGHIRRNHCQEEAHISRKYISGEDIAVACAHVACDLAGKEPVAYTRRGELVTRAFPSFSRCPLVHPQQTYFEADITVLRVIASGRRAGVATTLTWDLVDRYDPVSGLRSMSRTTAFPATIVARMMLDGRLALGPGVHPPEALGREPGVLKAILAELGRKGVTCTMKAEPEGASR